MTYSLIHNGTLIDGNGGPTVTDGAILTKDNRIQAVGPKASIPLPDEEVASVDVKGGYIMPGLIDTHVHLMFEGFDIVRRLNTPFSLTFYQAIDFMRRTIEAGITTVRDAGGADLGVKQAVEQGLVLGPRMQISVSVLSITGGHGDGWMPSGVDFELFSDYPGMPAGRVDGVDEVRKKVREILRAGAEIIKVCSTGGVLSPTDHPEFTQFTLEELEAMVQEGEYRRGIKVMAHAQGAEGVKNAVRAGIHSIEHGIYLDEEAIELMLEHDTFLVPTLLAPLAVLEMAEEKGNVPEWGVRKARETIEIHSDSIGQAYDAGVKIAMGTDSAVSPHGTNLRELGLMCNVGMSPMESLEASTRVAAQCLGWQDRVGTLEIGKLADVTVSKEDPLNDIRSLEDVDNITLVVKDGLIVKDIRESSTK
jgi:imidazolonepropionase-like amidohydrolase